VTDDGLPAGSTLTAIWNKYDGPGKVKFADEDALSTTATLAAVGGYRIRLRGRDGELQGQDVIRVAVQRSSERYRIVSFTLINADTEQAIPGYETLANGQSIAIASLPTRNVSIRANVTGTGHQSVRFEWDKSSNTRTDSELPYAISASGTNYTPFPGFTPGKHTLLATPFSKDKGSGSFGGALAITLFLQ
jgi:hypothetical protein